MTNTNTEAVEARSDAMRLRAVICQIIEAVEDRDSDAFTIALEDAKAEAALSAVHSSSMMLTNEQTSEDEHNTCGPGFRMTECADGFAEDGCIPISKYGLSPTAKAEPSTDVSAEQLNRIADFVSRNAPDYAKAIRRAAQALSAPTRERELLWEAREHGLLHVGNANPGAREKYNNLLTRIDNLLNEGTR